MSVRPSASPVPRLQGIDPLRGGLACSVMLYHYLSWTATDLGPAANRTLMAIAFYAVEAFFVISGMSLAFAYRHADFRKSGALLDYGIRRYFRIAPLFYLVLLATLAMKLAAVHVLHDPGVVLPSTGHVLGNVSLLFGVIDPSLSIVIAGWSIGIEIAFYLLFPILLQMMQGRSRGRMGLVCVASLTWAAVVANVSLSNEVPLLPQWPVYANVANHLPFFLAGMLLGRIVPTLASLSCRTTDALLAAGGIVFVLLSMATETEAGFATGWTRLAFSALTVAGVSLVARRPVRTSRMTALGRSLGDFSYAIYLTHFLSFSVLQQVLPRSESAWLIAAAAMSTLLVSAATFRWVETPMIALGKRLASFQRHESPSPVVRSEPAHEHIRRAA